jgi:hypothetical protein
MDPLGPSHQPPSFRRYLHRHLSPARSGAGARRRMRLFRTGDSCRIEPPFRRTFVLPRASHPVRPHAGIFRKLMFGVHLDFELTWAAVADARTIEDGPAIVHRPIRPEKLSLRADVEVALAVERKVGDALCRLLMSQTGMCGVMPLAITQWRNLPVPYAVSAASRSGLSPNRSSVRLITVFVAATRHRYGPAWPPRRQ